MAAELRCVALRGWLLVLRQEPSHGASADGTVWIYRYAESSGTFVGLEKTLPVGIPGGRVWKFERVLDRTSGICRPCLLVNQRRTKRSGSNETLWHLLFLSDDFDAISSLGSIQIEDPPPTAQIQLFDGPRVCWTSGASVHLLRLNAAGNLTLNSHSVPDIQASSFNIHWCGQLKGEIVVMGTAQTAVRGVNDKEIRWLFVDLSGGCDIIQDMVPVPYASIVTCACVLTRRHNTRVWHRWRESIGNSSSGTRPGSDVSVFVATSQGQLLEFTNGQLRNCCCLPFADPCAIQTLETGYRHVKLLVCSKGDQICAVDCSEWKVVCEWDGVGSVVSGDFLSTGTEQLLLLPHFSDEGVDPLSKFRLVDIKRGVHTIDSEQKGKREGYTSSNAGSLQSTAQALETQLQVGLASLAEAQVECNEKLQVIKKSCSAMENAASVDGSRPRIPVKYPGHLVSLVDGNFREDEISRPPAPNVSVTAAAIWQRVIQESWVIGADVKNSGTRPVSDLALSLVPQGTLEDMTCQSRTTFANGSPFLARHPTPHAHSSLEDVNTLPPATKRPRIVSNPQCGTTPLNSDSRQRKSLVLLPGNKVTLLVKSPLPSFSGRPRQSCFVIVTWTSHGGSGQYTRHSSCCGNVTLTVDQVLHSPHEVGCGVDNEERVHNNLVLNAVSMKTQFVIQFSMGSWAPLMSLLQSTLPVLVDVAESSSDREESPPVRVNSAGPLEGAGMVIYPMHKELCVQLWTRNERQVYLILHKLRGTLPDDATFHADPSLGSSYITSSLVALDEEMNALQKCLSKLLQHTTPISTASEHGAETRCNGRAETEEGRIRLQRKDFERRQANETTVRNVGLIQGDKLAEIWPDSFHDQMKTDCRIRRTCVKNS